MPDRQMKLLLAAAVIGLWGLLFRSWLQPTPATAADPPGTAARTTSPSLQVVHNQAGVVTAVYLAQDGNVYEFGPDLKLKSTALQGRNFGGGQR